MYLLKQDIQTHTNYSDGKNTITEMVERAIDIGLESIVISDHANGWVSGKGARSIFFSTCTEYENYLNELEIAKNFYKQHIKVLSGLEIEISLQGKMKLAPGIIEYIGKHVGSEKFGVDILLGSIHSESFEEDCLKQQITDQNDRRVALIKNMCNLLRSKEIDVFAHPFQALHGQFSDNLTYEEIQQILGIFKAEWDSGHTIIFEINGKKYPNYEQWTYNKYENEEMRTNDLNFLREYKKAGGKFALGSDAHSANGLRETDFSILNKLNYADSDSLIFS